MDRIIWLLLAVLVASAVGVVAGRGTWVRSIETMNERMRNSFKSQ